jgi:hypothetical protein
VVSRQRRGDARTLHPDLQDFEIVGHGDQFAERAAGLAAGDERV